MNYIHIHIKVYNIRHLQSIIFYDVYMTGLQGCAPGARAPEMPAHKDRVFFLSACLEQRLLRVCDLPPAAGLLEGGRRRIARVLDLITSGWQC